MLGFCIFSTGYIYKLYLTFFELPTQLVDQREKIIHLELVEVVNLLRQRLLVIKIFELP